MNYITILGLIAGALTSASLLPQVIKSWKTKTTKDLSLGTFALWETSVALWVIYGVILGEFPLILWNSVTLCLISAMIILKLKYK